MTISLYNNITSEERQCDTYKEIAQLVKWLDHELVTYEKIQAIGIYHFSPKTCDLLYLYNKKPRVMPPVLVKKLRASLWFDSCFQRNNSTNTSD